MNFVVGVSSYKKSTNKTRMKRIARMLFDIAVVFKDVQSDPSYFATVPSPDVPARASVPILPAKTRAPYTVQRS